MELYDFWAKTTPFQSVYTHGLISGIVGQILFREYLPAGTSRTLCEQTGTDEQALSGFLGYLISLHDIGKLCYQFQKTDEKYVAMMDSAGLKPEVSVELHYRHEKTTARIVRAIWKEGGIRERAFGDYAEILAAHHQGKTGESAPYTAGWSRFHREFETAMRDRFLYGKKPSFPEFARESKGAAQAVILGLVVLSDWISSSGAFSDAEALRREGLLEETVAAKTREFLELSGMQEHGTIPSGSFCDTWTNIPRGGERELQKQTETLFSDGKRYLLVLMEAPMGEGKTEAGVYAALKMAAQWNKQGFYVALPTSATSNQMVGRMRELLKQHRLEDSVRLMHSTAWMFDTEIIPDDDGSFDEETEMMMSWTVPKRKAMLVPYAVGTVDQAMMAAMFIKFGVLRLIGLSGKALIIDEVHAYDMYMQTILKELLAWCKALRVPVVLLSATLPKKKKDELLAVYGASSDDDRYPSITAVDENGTAMVLPFTKTAKHQTVSTELLPILNNPAKIAALAVEKTSTGGCTCVLMNTVRQAQDVFEEIEKTEFDGELMLFHSRFLAADRDEIEKRCLRYFGKEKAYRPEKAILVATQVVEQSLDVDFDYMISAIAPVDLLLQRMGREHRHSETARPEHFSKPLFSVLTPGTGKYLSDGYVYPECLLRQTERLLAEQMTVRIPEDLQERVQRGYSEEYVPAEELEKWTEHLIDESIRASAAQQYLLGSPGKKFAALHREDGFDDLESNSYLSAKTRLSESSVRVALLDDELYDRLSSPDFDFKTVGKETAKEVMLRSVSLTEKNFRKSIVPELKLVYGKGLLDGVVLLPAGNGCLISDKKYGVIRKEELHCK